MTNQIYTLPAPASLPAASLRDQIERALHGTEQPTIPGSTPDDRAWAFKRSVPTLVLYDEAGLRLYDRITADAPEYYLFDDELNLFKTHGAEIARAMGFGGSGGAQKEERKERDEQEQEYEVSARPWKPGRWGDVDVGKWNNGVNGEQGIGGGWNRGWDVVELGAGALRKTAHFLTALSSALPIPPADAASHPAPITYHALDLSLPELDRVLGEMDEAFGDSLKGRVDCVGLHGDYDAGLDLIRSGKLASLRTSPATSPSPLRDAHATLPSPELEHDSSEETDSPPPATPQERLKHLEPSPTFSPLSTHLGTPGNDMSPLPPLVDLSDLKGLGHSGNDLSGDAPLGPPLSITPDVSVSVSSMGNSSNGDNDDAQRRPLHLVFLGSSLGNFSRESAAPFLASLPLRKGDTFLLGLDGRPAPGPEGRRKVEVAYNDPHGHTRAFEEHGWDVVRETLELEGDKAGAGVEFVGRYNEVLGRHEAYYRSKERQIIPNALGDVVLEKDELLNIEWSYKYSLSESLELFNTAGLRVINSWKAPESEYRLWLLERPETVVAPTMTINPTVPKGVIERTKSVPKWDEWVQMWKIWDHITLQMIPKDLLHQRPIDLRHICLFYLGHIPTFLDIYLSRITDGTHTEPVFYKDIFERGIDPDVDDPTQCHSHSEVPTHESDWPALDEILAFRDRVRARVRALYDSIEQGDKKMSRFVGRSLFMGYEHEAMHAETLLYMLLQSPLTRPPTAVATPQWDLLAKTWAHDTAVQRVITVPAGVVHMGHRDLEAEDAGFPTHEGWEQHEFGWDIENPAVSIGVKGFKIDALPVSNNHYRAYLANLRADPFLSSLATEDAPASWVKVEGEWKVRTLYGPVGFDVAGAWPLMASKLEIEAYAKSKGGRLPTESELRALWEHPDGPRPAGQTANVGFKNWHPVPPTTTTTDNAGVKVHGHNGGVWEWTSTEFKGLEGYVPSELYPGYSADFFDGKHFVVLGGSFVTLQAIAERKSFRNWYQSNYKFSFIGGRVAYDA